MIQKWFVFFIISIVIFTIGCKKTSLSTTDLLTKNAWKLSSIKDNGIEVIVACEKDNVETYLAAGTYSYSKGSDDCSGDETDYSRTWELIANDTKIVHDGTDTISILTLDGNIFKYNYTDDPTFVYTLNH